jgi:hypothetical protein
MPPKPYRFVRFFVAWLFGSIIVLTAINALELELFFVLSLLGFLLLTELSAPIHIRPEWRRRLRWAIAVGLVVFAVIVARRALAILPVEFSISF